MSFDRISLPCSVDSGVDCLGSDDREDKNNYLKTRSFRVSKSVDLNDVNSENPCTCKNLKTDFQKLSVTNQHSERGKV